MNANKNATLSRS